MFFVGLMFSWVLHLKNVNGVFKNESKKKRKKESQNPQRDTLLGYGKTKQTWSLLAESVTTDGSFKSVTLVLHFLGSL